MKILKITLLAISILTFYSIKAQVAVTTDGSSADGSAMLEVKSIDKGFLPPRLSSNDIQAINSPAAGLMMYDYNLNKPVYFDGTDWRLFSGAIAYPPPEFGIFYGGGVVFYIFESGDPGYVPGEIHGLICAPSDLGSASWGCRGTTISGADGTAIGTGAQNTIDILNGCNTSGIAADLCANLTLNGYDDWFLPSIDELYQMYLYRAAISTTAEANGGSAIAEARYGSSTEHDSDFCYTIHFLNGSTYNWEKNFSFFVRAIRAF